MSVLTAAKSHAPRALLDAADASTRLYALATAGQRVVPDYFVVGTKRGGTTSLWNWLDAHPQVLSMFPRVRGLKSPEFFFDEGARGERWYRSHFHTRTYRSIHTRLRGGAVNGEASPYYMYGPHIPRQLARSAPEARIIVLLRNPVERAYSHFWERTGRGVETLSFAEALAAEERRTARARLRVEADPSCYEPAYDYFSYRHRGIYLPQLQRIHDSFPAEQVLLLRSEDLYADPQAAFDSTCEFLGISHHLIGSPSRHNEIRRDPMDPQVRQQLAEFYAPHNAELEAYLGRRLGWS